MLVVAGLLLFAGYARISATHHTSADGAANAVQAWDLLHGNLILHGWTLSDVPFYTTELPEYALLELVFGYHSEVLWLAPALTYLLIVLLAAALAKGPANDGPSLVRAAIAVGILLVPQPGPGILILLGSPDHTGSAVALLLCWLLLDRHAASRPRWLPWVVGGLLAWAAIGDPLVALLGSAGLVTVSGIRLALPVRRRPVPASAGPSRRSAPWHGMDAALLYAGALSLFGFWAALRALRLLGGFGVQPVISGFGTADTLAHRLAVTRDGVAALFGTYLPHLHGRVSVTLGLLRLAIIGVVAAAVGIALVRLVRDGRRSDRVEALCAAGIVLDLGAFVVSKLPLTIMSAREIAPVLPLAAVLAARVWGPLAVRTLRRARSGRPAAMLAAGVAGSTAALLCAALVQQAGARTVDPTGRDLRTWLQARRLTYGLGGYWLAEPVTLDSSGTITVAPMTGRDRIHGYRWESRDDWYDPRRHDARFVIIDLTTPGFGTVATAERQFGPPVDRQVIGRAEVLVYDHNLLVGLPAWCATGKGADSMAGCARL